MQTSRQGFDLICSFEGWVNHAYNDWIGVSTIAFGHVIRPGEVFPAIITKDQGLELLSKDVRIAEVAINNLVKVPLNQNQFDALSCFTFNVGTGALARSTLLIKLNAGDYQGAADEFPKWCQAGGKPNDGLRMRRLRERDLFLKPYADPLSPEEHAEVLAQISGSLADISRGIDDGSPGSGEA